MAQKSKHLVIRIETEQKARAAVIPSDVPAHAKLSVLRVLLSKSPVGLDTIEIEGTYGSERVVVYPTLRTWADCFPGERVMVETELGWLDGTVQDKE